VTGRAAVVGGGISGLATAALLAAEGHEVDLFEQQPALGGRAGSWESGGFRFDTGPSWYLMPEVFEHFFELLGTSVSDHLDLRPLDPAYRVFYEGEDEPVDVVADTAANVATFERLEPGAGRRLEEYLRSASDAYRVALRRFLYTNFTTPLGLASPDILLRGPQLAPLLTSSLERFVARRFRDRRLRQVLGYPAVFLGSSPDRTPALYHLMSALDLTGGVRYPMGGFARLIEVIAALAAGRGVRLHTGATVTAVTTGPGDGARSRPARATGITWRDGAGAEHHHPADLVVAAADLHHVETTLLPRHLQTYPQEYWDRRTSGPGAVLVLLGVRGRLPELAHHSLFFTRDWQANFDDVFGGRVPDPASAYVCKPSETDPAVAPPGHENLFVLVPVPADVRRRGRRGRRDRAGGRLGRRPRPGRAGRGPAHPGPDGLRRRPVLLARRDARPGSHPAAERVLPVPQRLPEGRGPLLRRRQHDPRHRPADVPHQRRAGRQAPARRRLDLAAGGAAVTPLLYAAALAVPLVCMGLLDHRFGLVLWRDTRRGVLVLLLGVVFFLLWDLAAIAAGFYHRGESEAMTGLLLAPELPVEELLFITFLCYTTLVLRGLVDLAVRRRRAA